MQITHVATKAKMDIVIEPLSPEDYKVITKKRYWFDWKTEKRNLVYKLKPTDTEDILGLLSLIQYDNENRFEINLLAVSKENRGSRKIYEGIAGNLIAYACREAIKLYAENGCVSLISKTDLKKHYIKKYGMIDAGWQLFLEGQQLFNLLSKYQL